MASVSPTTEPLAGVINAGAWDEAHRKARATSVCLQVAEPVPHDVYDRESGYASGNIVDKSRGIVLTNRHVVAAGPSCCFASVGETRQVSLVPVL